MDDAAQIAQWLRLFIEPGQVTELRAIEVAQRYGRPQTIAGFFDHDHLADMAREALRLSPAAVGVYFVPNPVKPDLLARCANRVATAKESQLTQDRHIVRRRWFLVDADPVREDGISATDAEKFAAWEAIQNVREFLAAQILVRRQVLADSGNGYHLLCAVDLATDDGEMVRHLLSLLGDHFDTPRVKIDRKVFNAARIVKLYGTASRKGDHTEHRPHRTSKVIEVTP